MFAGYYFGFFVTANGLRQISNFSYTLLPTKKI
jgi:hypothetical protein